MNKLLNGEITTNKGVLGVFGRLANLIKLQLGGKFKAKKGDKVMPFLFKILAFILVGAGAFGIFYIMEKMIYLKPTSAMILFIIFISQVITLIANAMELTESLYGSKDNAILFSLPAKHQEIFVSKLAVFYILELYSNIMFMLPILVAFGIYSKMGVAFFVLSVVISFLLPVVSVLIGAIISIPLSFIKKLFRSVSVLYVFLIIGLFVVLFIFATNIISGIPKPLRFTALYNHIISLILEFIDRSNRYALFYEWFYNIIFGYNTIINLLFVLALIAGLFGVNFLCAWPLFFTLSANSTETAIETKHKGKNVQAKNTFVSFFKKEVVISLRSIGSTFSNYSMIIFMPLILYIINGLFNSFDLSSLGRLIVFGFNVLIGLLILTCSNASIATSLSEEGSEFVLLKTSPVDTKLIAWAKILNSSIISLVIILVSAIILGVMNTISFEYLVYVVVSYVLVDFAHIMWSFQLDLRNPQIKDVALTGTISNKSNVSKSLGIGIVLSVLFGAFAILFFYVGLVPVYFILLFVIVAWRFFVFNGNLKAYFYDIEL